MDSGSDWPLPLSHQGEIGTNIDAACCLPPCMIDLTPCTTALRILSLAEVGSTASADHLGRHPKVLSLSLRSRHEIVPSCPSAHIMLPAISLAAALQTGRSTVAIAGVFGAGKTRSLTFLLLAMTTNLKIGVVHKENPAGRNHQACVQTMSTLGCCQICRTRRSGADLKAHRLAGCAPLEHAT